MKRTFTLHYEEHFLSLLPEGGVKPDKAEVKKTTDSVDEILMVVRIALEGPSVKPDPITIQIHQED